MHSAFVACGGTLDTDQLSLLMRSHHDQPISCLARWIVQRKVVSFDHCGHTLFPLFQFELPGVALRPGVSDAIASLEGAFDGDDLAHWFASPNDWLGGRSPASVSRVDARALLEAARADRFVVKG